jgi:hypothetical protein
MQEVVEVVDRHLEPFDGLRPAIGHRGGEVASVESIAFFWASGGEVVEGLIAVQGIAEVPACPRADI